MGRNPDAILEFISSPYYIQHTKLANDDESIQHESCQANQLVFSAESRCTWQAKVPQTMITVEEIAKESRASRHVFKVQGKVCLHN